MEWLKKNRIMLIILMLSALPLIHPLSSVLMSVTGSGNAITSHAPDEIRNRVLHAGRPISQWSMPLHLTGEWAIRMMVITLSCTPLSILLGNIKIRRYKKVFGIYTFVYTVFHLAFYLADKNFFDIFGEMNLIVALIATAIIIPLGLTSNNLSKRLLKKNWKKLQEFAYAAAATSVLHLALLGKHSWLLYAVLLVVGFIIRIPDVKRYFEKSRNTIVTRTNEA